MRGAGIPEPITRIVLETLIGTLQEQQNNLEKLRRLVGSYYQGGMDYLADAKSIQGERREQWIKSALDQFITASHVEDTLLAANSQFFVGVCYDLLSESPLAREWYERAYTAAYQLIAQSQRRPQEFKQLQQFMNSLSQVLLAHGSTLSIAQLIPALGFNFYNNQGNVLYQLQRYAEALAAYEQAIRLDPNDATLYSNKGHAVQHLGRHEEVLAAYEQAIRLDPNDVTYHNNKGNTLYALKRYTEALAAYEQAIRLDPNSALAYNNKAKVLERLGREKKAQKFYGKARRLEFHERWLRPPRS